ncbi:DUF2284 domain-containing protein [Gemmatimonadota bacterium]
MNKYIDLAIKMKMINAILISSDDIHFDIRTMLKCKWGCENCTNNTENIRCHDRGITYQERVEIIKRYNHILLLHCNNSKQLSVAVLEIERIAFLDGYYFASAIRNCSLCSTCVMSIGEPCPTPERIRPCDALFGIDVYKTARDLDLPISVLKDKNDVQNRYGFVLID